MTKKILLWAKDDLLDYGDEADIEESEDQDDEESDDLASNEAEITNDSGQKVRVRLPKSQEVIFTNFGQFLAHHPDNPYNTREIFIAQANFDITDDLIKTICTVPGVEAFRIISRYSFTIIIGLIFYANDVLDEIDRVCGIEKEDELSEKTQERVDTNQAIIENTIATIDAKFWFCYIMPNGETVMEQYETEELMNERHPFFLALNSMSEGLLLSSQKIED